jgi:hypothetical protein
MKRRTPRWLAATIALLFMSILRRQSSQVACMRARVILYAPRITHHSRQAHIQAAAYGGAKGTSSHFWVRVPGLEVHDRVHARESVFPLRCKCALIPMRGWVHVGQTPARKAGTHLARVAQVSLHELEGTGGVVWGGVILVPLAEAGVVVNQLHVPTRRLRTHAGKSGKAEEYGPPPA